jgi:hypothetical protein
LPSSSLQQLFPLPSLDRIIVMSPSLSWIWAQARAATSTLHVRPFVWWALFALEALSMFVAIFLGFYCASSERCPSAGYWPKEVWGGDGPNHCSGGWLCEHCDTANIIHSPVGSLSNVSFIMVAWIIFCLGLEDIYYFHYSKSDNVHQLQDYTRASPPSLMLASSGLFHLIPSVLGSLALHYAGIGAFLYHASFTPAGSKYDLASVWTLTTIILPYCALNHLFIIKNIPYWGSRVAISIAGLGMLVMFALPCT